MKVELQLLEARASEECGCPEELWLVGGCETTIHVEPDGDMHCIIDNGSEAAEMTFQGSIGSLDDARDLLLGWAAAMLYSRTGWG